MIREVQKELLNKINIVDLISEYVQLKPKGSSFVGLSPFKKEKTPSFIVSPEKNIFKDFSSGYGGNVIKFFMYINNISYDEAIYQLAKKYNIETQGFSKYNDENKIYYDILEMSLKYYEQNIQNSDVALSYLQDRGYTQNDITNFKLGFAGSDWDGLLKYMGNRFKIEQIKKAGLVSDKNSTYYDVFRNRIMFPIFDIKGRIVGYGGRDISDKDKSAKYINSKETKIFKKSNEIYGLFDRGELIKKFNNCILVEGFFDVLALHKHNIKTAIASLGTALTQNQVGLISKLTKNIVIAYDDDEAGQLAKIKAIYLLNEKGFNIKVMNLEKRAKDPDEFLKKFGREEFILQYNKACDPIDFLYDYYSKDYTVINTTVKRQIINSLKPYFSSLTSSIIFDEAINKLAKKLGLKKEIVEQELKVRINSKAKKESVYEPTNYVKGISSTNQLEKQTLNLIRKDIKKYHNKFINFEFSDPIYTSIYHKMGLADFSKTLFNNEEKEAYFDICTENINDEKLTYTILYRSWIIEYIKESLKEILEIKGAIDAFKDDEYERYIEQKGNLKKLNNNTNIDDIESIFKKYIDYERKELV